MLKFHLVGLDKKMSSLTQIDNIIPGDIAYYEEHQ